MTYGPYILTQALTPNNPLYTSITKVSCRFIEVWNIIKLIEGKGDLNMMFTWEITSYKTGWQ